MPFKKRLRETIRISRAQCHVPEDTGHQRPSQHLCLIHPHHTYPYANPIPISYSNQTLSGNRSGKHHECWMMENNSKTSTADVDNTIIYTHICIPRATTYHIHSNRNNTLQHNNYKLHNYDTKHQSIYQHAYIHNRNPNVPLKSDIHIHHVHENTNTNNKHPKSWMRKVDFKHVIYMRASRSPIPVSPSSGT
jgi:hypothetical protein